jgi:hypothetical protein
VADGRTYGAKNASRNSHWARATRFTRIAIVRPSSTSGIAVSAVKTMVLRTAIQNVGLVRTSP